MNKALKITLMVLIMVAVLALIITGLLLTVGLLVYLVSLIAPYVASIKMFIIPILIILGLVVILGIIPLAINWLCFLALMIWQKLGKEKPKTELPNFDRKTPLTPEARPTPIATPTPITTPEKVIPAINLEKSAEPQVATIQEEVASKNPEKEDR